MRRPSPGRDGEGGGAELPAGVPEEPGGGGADVQVPRPPLQQGLQAVVSGQPVTGT